MPTIGAIKIIRTDKDTHYTSAIAAGEMETEDINFPKDWQDSNLNECIIEGISIQSEDNLAWDIGIWDN